MSEEVRAAAGTESYLFVSHLDRSMIVGVSHPSSMSPRAWHRRHEVSQRSRRMQYDQFGWRSVLRLAAGTCAPPPEARVASFAPRRIHEQLRNNEPNQLSTIIRARTLSGRSVVVLDG